MNIYKNIKVSLIALSLISLTSCNFVENLAIENLAEQPAITTETEVVTTLNDTTSENIETTENTDITINTTQTTSSKTKTSNTKNDGSKYKSKNITSNIEKTTTTIASSINLNEITTPAYNDNYVTTTEEPTYSTDIYTYSTDVDTTTTPNEQESSINTIDKSYLEKYCAFIGDSLTVGLSAYGFIPEEHTFAKEGVTLKGINSLQLQTDNGYLYPQQAVASWKLKEVYIMLGINGVSWIDNNEAISEYATLINNIRQYNPSIQINIISVLPVSYSMETIDTVANGRILNSEIDTFNTMIQSMANQLGCHYINANAYMKNQNGYLYDDLTFDGLHLTMSGYERLLDILVQDVQLRN